MAQFPYYPWYPSDFRSSTSHYSLIEKAVYRELLDWSWLNGPLPEDDRRLAQICGCTLRSFRAAWREVGSKFEANGAGLVNPRLEDIRKKAKEISDKRSDAGRRGGLANAQASAGANAKQTDKQTASSHSQSQTPKPFTRTPPNPPPPGGGRARSLSDEQIDQDFSKLWDAWPRQQHKIPARRSYLMALRNGIPEIGDLLNLIGEWRQTADWKKAGGNFVPRLDGWLDGQRWNEKPPESEDAEWEIVR